jgi:hypothetical protein
MLMRTWFEFQPPPQGHGVNRLRSPVIEDIPGCVADESDYNDQGMAECARQRELSRSTSSAIVLAHAGGDEFKNAAEIVFLKRAA